MKNFQALSKEETSTITGGTLNNPIYTEHPWDVDLTSKHPWDRDYVYEDKL